MRFVVLFIFLSTVNCFAHDTNKAYYNLKQNAETVEIIAEFPWTIRKALMLYAPELEYSTSQFEFDAAFYNYIVDHIILKDAQHNPLDLIEVTKVDLPGHSHKNNYKLIFKGSEFTSISNTILFNLNKTQQNQHKYSSKNGSFMFITSPSSSTYNLKMNQKKRTSTYWMLILFWSQLV